MLRDKHIDALVSELNGRIESITLEERQIFGEVWKTGRLRTTERAEMLIRALGIMEAVELIIEYREKYGDAKV